jgi:hypothetical protein
LVYFEDIEIIKRRLTGGFIPNAIEIVSGSTSYTFASFLRRDAAFDQMTFLWKQSNVESYFCTSHHFERIDEIKVEPISDDSENAILIRPTTPEAIEKVDCLHDHSKNTILCDEKFPVKMSALVGLLYGDHPSLVVMSASQLDLQKPIPFMDWFMISRRGVSNLTKTNWVFENHEITDTDDLVIGATRTISFDMNVGIQTASSKSVYSIVSKTDDAICVKAITTNTGVPFANSFKTIIYSCIRKTTENQCQLQMSFYVDFNTTGFTFLKGPMEQAIKNRVPEYYQDLVQVLHDNFADGLVEEKYEELERNDSQVVLYQPPVVVEKDDTFKVFQYFNHYHMMLCSIFVMYAVVLVGLSNQMNDMQQQLLVLQKELARLK